MPEGVGYNNVLQAPSMPGMGAAGVAANVQNVGQTPMGNPGDFQSTPAGDVFNTSSGEMQQPGFFGRGGMAQMGIGAISTLGSLWNSFQQNKIAKRSLNLQEKTFDTNLANQTQSYNTAMEDRIRTQYDSERRDPAEADAYLEKNKL